MKYNLQAIFSISLFSKELSIGKFSISEEKLEGFFYSIIKIIVILILMYIIIKVGDIIINKYIKRQSKFKISLNEKKSKTIGAILKSALKYSVYFFGIFAIISIISPTLTISGITFAGIGGVALGLGAQNLIKDVINGFFILFEDQFSVGDYVDIEDKSGIIESFELRVTKLRDFNGDLHIIPNGLITKVTNHSRGNMRIIVDIDISYNEDVNLIISKISELCEKFSKENKAVTEGPSVYGVTNLKDGVATIRILGKTKPMEQFDLEIKLRQEIIEMLKKNNIKVPYKKIEIIKGD
ncbi:mechanosensitive ion channel family protein [Clostridium sp. cel8]|uniref:mechanosensitive ion channel family protein n=1 Tax=unclassified Clostridium TaxID=2614128 RepID=UPI0015F3B737|nr:mechanosensitive ion channel family protein [Clostridium sp. cel8]MBA5851655.1 mechanosensitive ion channel family protein [Clostridium sp. cel8]